jgi:hypothetical protein
MVIHLFLKLENASTKALRQETDNGMLLNTVQTGRWYKLPDRYYNSIALLFPCEPTVNGKRISIQFSLAFFFAFANFIPA